jgi:hypothetical protein
MISTPDAASMVPSASNHLVAATHTAEQLADHAARLVEKATAQTSPAHKFADHAARLVERANALARSAYGGAVLVAKVATQPAATWLMAVASWVTATLASPRPNRSHGSWTRLRNCFRPFFDTGRVKVVASISLLLTWEPAGPRVSQFLASVAALRAPPHSLASSC